MVEREPEELRVGGPIPSFGTNGSVTLTGKGVVLKTTSRREIAVHVRVVSLPPFNHGSVVNQQTRRSVKPFSKEVTGAAPV